MLDNLDNDVLWLICQMLQDEVKGNKDVGHSNRHKGSKTTLKYLSLTSKRFRTLCIPFILREFNLCCEGKRAWSRSAERLALWDPDFARFVRVVSVSIIPAPVRRRPPPLPGSGRPIALSPHWDEEPDLFDSSLPEKLAAVLSQFSGLVQSLTMNVDKSNSQFFGEAFARHSLVFPNVTYLVIGPYNEFMVKHCTNAKILSGDQLGQSTSLLAQIMDTGTYSDEYCFRFMSAVATLKKVKQFKYSMVDKWTQDLMEGLYNALPDIEMLDISSLSIQDPISLEMFIMFLSRFKSIKVLNIPGPADLNVGYYVPWCGNAYFGRGQELRRKLREEGEAQRRRIASQCFDRCKNLQELWFGSFVKVTVANCAGKQEVVEETGEGRLWRL